MLQSGYAADFVLGLTVESLNGVRNRSASAGVTGEAEPEFVRVLQLIREVQLAGAVGMRLQEGKDKDATAVMFFRRENLSPEIADKLVEIRRLLKLPEGQHQFKLIYSSTVGGVGELAVGSRSMLQIMLAFASYVDVPESDTKEGRAIPSLQSNNADPVKIKCHDRANRLTLLPPCIITIIGSGLTTATGVRSARYRPSCFCSR